MGVKWENRENRERREHGLREQGAQGNQSLKIVFMQSGLVKICLQSRQKHGTQIN